jgi:hypothetical protein
MKPSHAPSKSNCKRSDNGQCHKDAHGSAPYFPKSQSSIQFDQGAVTKEQRQRKKRRFSSLRVWRQL